MKNSVFLILTIACLFFSCTKQNDPVDIEVRVSNSTSIQINSIAITGAGKKIAFSALEPGFTTGYKTVSHTNIEHPACSVYVDQKADPYHCFDEEASLLTPGSYTCFIKYVNEQMVIKFIKD